MELFGGERNSYEHQLQWYSTSTYHFTGPKTQCPRFLERESNTFFIKIAVINALYYHTPVCSTYLHEVIPGFLHCFLMEEEFLSSALKIQTEE